MRGWIILLCARPELDTRLRSANNLCESLLSILFIHDERLQTFNVRLKLFFVCDADVRVKGRKATAVKARRLILACMCCGLLSTNMRLGMIQAARLSTGQTRLEA